MADVLLRLAAAFRSTQTAGQPNQDLIDLTTPVGVDDGLVLGDSGSGINSTGITLTTNPRTRPKPPVPGTRVAPDPFFVREDISSFQMSWPFAGNRKAYTAAGDDGTQFVPDVGIDALLKASGMVASTVAGSATYAIGTPTTLNGIVWDGGNAGGNKTGVRSQAFDALVNTLSIVYAAGEVPIATADIAGALAAPGEGTPNGFTRELTFPAVLNYGDQFDRPPELVGGVNGQWNNGTAATQRCFNNLTLTYNNGVAQVGDSCQPDGFRREQTLPVEPTISGQMITNDADFDAEWDSMTRAQTAAATYSFTVGTAVSSDGDRMAGHQVTITGIRVTSLATSPLAETGKRAIDFEAAVQGIFLAFV